MELEVLHRDIDLKVPTKWRVMFHLLADLGRLERVECQMSDCVGDTRELSTYQSGASGGNSKRGVEYDPWTCTINHITATANGGVDRAENIELAHARCNYRDGGKIADNYVKGRGWFSEENKEKARKAAAEASKRPEVREKRAVSMKSHWDDPVRSAQHRARISEANKARWAKYRNDKKTGETA